jgi:molybdopterin/thiamine biosynthesis adenylyltransferase
MTEEALYLKKLKSAVELVARAFNKSRVSVVQGAVGGALTDLVQLALPPRANLYFIPTPHFPEVPPTVIVQWDNGDDREYLTLQWPVDGDPAEKIINALKLFIHPSDEYITAFGLDPAQPLTCDPKVAARAGWRRLLTGKAPAPSASEVARSRIDPALVDAFSSCNVLVVGLGSVGSYMAEQLVRSGVGHLALVDHDLVEDANLSRTIYDRRDVGLSKARALERRLLNIAPDVNLDVFDGKFQNIHPKRLRELFSSADLVIAATDDPVAQAQINSCAQYSDKPAIHIGLYRGAKGGEVVLSVPSLTPCFRCQVGATRLLSSDGVRVTREMDYGTGRLRGELALGCDIQHVSSAALKLALSLLAALKKVDGALSSFTIGALQRGLHMLTLGMEPEWWFYPEVFGETAGQYAFQSVWLSTEQQADCSDCGVGRERTDPFDHIANPVDIEQLRKLIDDSEQDS